MNIVQAILKRITGAIRKEKQNGQVECGKAVRQIIKFRSNRFRIYVSHFVLQNV